MYLSCSRSPARSWSMSASYGQRLTIHGLDVYPPTPDAGNLQCEWHAGRLMARLADAEPTKDNFTKGRKRLDKSLQQCKDIHTLMWPGQPAPLLPNVSDRHRPAGSVTRLYFIPGFLVTGSVRSHYIIPDSVGDCR